MIRRLLRSLGATALVPLSVVPIALAVPIVVGQYQQAALRHAVATLVRSVLPAPRVRLDGSFPPLPEYRDAIPVLVYHGVQDRGDNLLDVSRERFAQQMAMLHQAGFHTISIEQYARWQRGERIGLPARPILLTFDDGRYDTWQGADQVLKRYGLRATIFLITGASDSNNPFHVHWREARKMAASGRWDLQLHAHAGHHLVTTDAAGDQGPFYAYRTFRAGRMETYAAFQRRVTTEVDAGIAALRRNIPGFRPWAFSTPYGNLGVVRSNDSRIGGFVRGLLESRFAAVFEQETPGYSTPVGPRETERRHEVHRTTTAGSLYRWLRAANPGD